MSVAGRELMTLKAKLAQYSIAPLQSGSFSVDKLEPSQDKLHIDVSHHQIFALLWYCAEIAEGIALIKMSLARRYML